MKRAIQLAVACVAVLVVAAGQVRAGVVIVDIDLDSPTSGGPGDPGTFIRYDYTFDIDAGANELILRFLNHRHLELVGLDAVRMGFFPTANTLTATGQFSNEFGELIGPPFVMDRSASSLVSGAISNENITGSISGLNIIAHDFHLFYDSESASTGRSGGVVFDVRQRGGGSIAIGDWTPEPTVVPEPTSLTLLGIGVAGLFGYGWRRRRKTELVA